MLEQQNAVAVLTAIAGLWPIALTVAVPVSLYIIRDRFSDIKWKKGDTEASVSTRPSSGDSDGDGQAKEVTDEGGSEPETDVEETSSLDGEALAGEPQKIEEQQNKLFLAAIDEKKFDKAVEMMSETLSAVDDIKKRKEHEARMRFLIAAEGHRESRDALLLMCDDGEAAGAACFWAGHYYTTGGNRARAEEYWTAGMKSSDLGWCRACTASLASSFRRSGEPERAVDTLVAQLSVSGHDDDGLAYLHKQLSEAYEDTGDEMLRAVSLHTSAVLAPSSAGKRFDASYHATQSPVFRANEYAIWGYRIVQGIDPEHAIALNNLGASYGRENLPVHKVDLYRSALSAGATIAAGNLATELVEAGFIKEAESVLREVEDLVDAHENVSRAAAQVRTARADEAEKVEALIARGQKTANFLSEFASAYYAEGMSGAAPVVAQGTWKCNREKMVVTRKGNTLHFEVGDTWRSEATTQSKAGVGTIEVSKYTSSYRNKYWSSEGQILIIVEQGNRLRTMMLRGKSTSIDTWVLAEESDTAAVVQ